MDQKHGDSQIPRPRGQLTTKVARAISHYWEPRGYYVLYDHDPSSHNAERLSRRLDSNPPGEVHS